ncbi:MAG: LPS assembly lipoprotein LptE [Arenicellales bacterium]|nr:LPS assembly lipoprotein LptE [Arenicellales bacterium]MDP7563203.1 LPS assembly lipoprotein LptE [Arenicellales bacterium]MEE1567268.1 LPS assembly lipoprotein LptE [Arenicellales bacterium]
MSDAARRYNGAHRTVFAPEILQPRRNMLKRALLYATAVIVLSACGFHLRGQVELAPLLSAPWVKSSDAALAADLRNALRQSGVTPVKDPAVATAIIDLVSVNYSRSVQSVDARGIATGYRLKYHVIYRVVDRSGRLLVDNTGLSVTRDLAYQSDQVLQKQKEEKILREALRQDVVRQIIRRLGGVTLSRNTSESGDRATALV